jgi:hypothetical protein
MTPRKQRNNGSRRARLVAGSLGAIIGILVFGAGAAFAYWAYTDSSNAHAAQAVADSIPQGATPGTPTVNTPNGTTVSFSFAQVSTTSGHIPLTSYTITRYTAPGDTSPTVMSATCTITSGTVSCSVANVPSGTWSFTDTPFLSGTSWTGTASGYSPSVTVDTTSPTASAPGVSAATTYGSNPVWVNNETVTLTDTPTDAGGTGVASVAYYYCASSVSSCTSSSPWTSIGSSSTGPNWTVSWSSLPADGTYKIVAVATGNNTNVSSPSAPSLVGVDTTAPTVVAPSISAAITYVNGSITYVDNENVTLTEAATDAGSGVASVSYYYCAGSSGPCTNGTLIGSSSTSSGNFSVSWNTPLPADGPYQIVAVATDNVGNSSNPSSAPTTAVTVDTTPPSVSPPSVNGY